MKDKNQIIGFALLALLTFGYFWYTQTDAKKIRAIEQLKQDSIKAAQAKLNPNDTLAQTKKDSAANAQNQIAKNAASFAAATTADTTLTAQTDLATYIFSTKGGFLKQVTLKKYKQLSKDKTTENVHLQSNIKQIDGVFYNIATSTGNVNTKNITFGASKIEKNTSGATVVTLEANSTDGKKLSHIFTLANNNYMVNWDISASANANFFTNNTINANWALTLDHKESDNEYDIQNAELSYKDEKEYDYYKLMNGKQKTFSNPVKWVGVHQRFFATAIVPQEGKTLNKVDINVVYNKDSSNAIITSNATFDMAFDATTNKANTQLYYGPVDYNELKQYNNSMEDMVNFGQGIFSFVKYINRYVILPFFNMLTGFMGNYGIIILLMTLFIRLLTSPLVYKSYLSGAKMKLLKPDLEVLKKKHGDDTQAYSMDQMKLFREAGVNPLGGCIPALIQMPIFISLYNFFNSTIGLRGKEFLWSKDLSVFDSIANLGFDIPFYGGHVSLFTILTVIASLLISLQTMNSTPDQNNPLMKYMPYIFPVIMLGFFNRLPAALTWYYFVSNLFTLVLQFCIQKFILNPDKIRAEMEEKKKKNKNTKSKWQTKLEDMQKSQAKIAEIKNKNKN